MKRIFRFTDNIGEKNHQYRLLEDISEIKEFATQIETEFGKEYHIHIDHTKHPLKFYKHCSYVNFQNWEEVEFPGIEKKKKEFGIPKEYHLRGDNIEIFLKNVKTDSIIGVQGNIRLPKAMDISEYDPFLSKIE